MNNSFFKRIFLTLIIAAVAAFWAPTIFALEDVDSQNIISLVIGDIETVTAADLIRVSITNPEIADISDAQGGKVSVLAKKAGKTVLFLWDKNGKRSIKIRVVSEDLNVVKSGVEKILQEASVEGLTLEVNENEGKVAVSGAVTKENKLRIDRILDRYKEGVLNFVREKIEQDLVQIDMQIVEISTSLEKNLGIQWGSQTSGSSSGASGGSGNTSANGQINLNYNETLPSSNGKVGDFFKIGDFKRTSPLEATVNALIQEGKARLISKPRLVAVSGKQASFLVGGEIPIQNTTSNSTGTSQTTSVSYSQYGVNLMVTPTIREGKIDIVLNVDIRDIDASNSSNGNVAFITRSATTDVLMENKQTVALAGLIKYSDSVQVTEVPFVSKIPIVGILFRNRSTPSPQTNTEMVIIMTPMVLSDKKFAEKQTVIPTVSENQAWQEIDSKYEHESLPVAKASTPELNSKILPTQEITNYARMVQERISKMITYPAAAMRHTWEGTSRLKLTILKNGMLAAVELIRSSGHDVFDDDALHAAKAAAPYKAFTAGMTGQENLIFTIPIVYKVAPRGQTVEQKVIASY